jgi:hypothetical protein
MSFDLTTKTGKVFEALVIKGEVLTPAQITKKFGIKSPSSVVSTIKYAGFPIYANVRKDKKSGVRVTEYRHGKASRKLVAAGYKAIAMGLVD